MTDDPRAAAGIQPCPWCSKPISRAYVEGGKACEHCGKPLVYVIASYAIESWLAGRVGKRGGSRWKRKLPYCPRHGVPRPTCAECERARHELARLEAG